MSDNTTTKPKQFTFLDPDRRQVIFTPRKYDPKTGHLIGVNQSGKPACVDIADFLKKYEPVELKWD